MLYFRTEARNFRTAASNIVYCADRRRLKLLEKRTLTGLEELVEDTERREDGYDCGD